MDFCFVFFRRREWRGWKWTRELELLQFTWKDFSLEIYTCLREESVYDDSKHAMSDLCVLQIVKLEWIVPPQGYSVSIRWTSCWTFRETDYYGDVNRRNHDCGCHYGYTHTWICKLPSMKQVGATCWNKKKKKITFLYLLSVKFSSLHDVY